MVHKHRDEGYVDVKDIQTMKQINFEQGKELTQLRYLRDTPQSTYSHSMGSNLALGEYFPPSSPSASILIFTERCT